MPRVTYRKQLIFNHINAANVAKYNNNNINYACFRDYYIQYS